MSVSPTVTLPMRRFVALLAVLIFVPLGLLAFLSIHLSTRAVREEAEERVRSNAALTANSLQSGFVSSSALLTSFAGRPTLQAVLNGAVGPDATRLNSQLRQLRKDMSGAASASFVSPQGRLITTVPPRPGAERRDLSRQDWYRGVTRTGKPYISYAYREGTANVIAVAAPVRARTRGAGEGALRGFLVTTIELTPVQRFVDYFSEALGVELEVTDQRGVLLAAPGQKQARLVSRREDTVVKAALEGRSGVDTVQSEQGRLLSAYAPVPGIGWTVAAKLPERTAFARVDGLRSTVLAVAGALALVLLAALGLLARTLRQRQRAEQSAAQERLGAERARLEAEVARADAEQANHAKSEFLSRMSHELRTPLNAVLGFGQLLAMRDLDEDERESVDQILKGGGHLLSLINEVLDLTRIETGKLPLSLEPVEIWETVSEVIQLVRPLADDREVEIAADPRNANEYVMADRQRLSQVLLNLVANAIKYNRTGGSVRIAISASSEESMRLEVSDTGHGISPDGLARLFTPFERLGAGEIEVEGTGLGLTLSKGLVEAMGGRIGVHSQLGEGSTFWIELQGAKSPLAPSEATFDGPGVPAAASSDEPYTILYVEDNLSNLKLVQRILGERPDFKLIAAMQGRLGLELAREHRLDLVLLDLHLPDITGDEVLTHLQADPDTAGIPVVVLSADATRGRIQRLLAQGAAAYLSKPFDVQEFLAVVGDHARRRVTAET